MAIPFAGIPNPILTPGAYIEYNAERAVQGLAPLPNRVLLVGARLAAGAIPANTLTLIRSAGDADTMFGRGSQIGAMAKAFKAVNQTTELWGCGLTAAGTAATKTITVSGTATGAGTLHFWVGGRGPIDVAVASGAIATAVASAIDAAFALFEADWMYTFAVTAAVVTGTSRHGAAFGQDFDIRLNYGSRESLDAPPGITIAIANGVSGATDPAVSAAITAIGDQWFQTIVSGVNLDANMDLWETFAAAQWGPLIQQDVMVFAGYAGVYADALTYAGDRNSQFTVVPYMGVTPTPWWETVTRVAAASTAEPDPARPRQTLSIGAVSGPPVSAAFTRSDRETLLAAGISTLKIALDGAVTIERLVTTYTTNPAGLPDATFRNLETMLTLFALRFTTRARFQSKYPRHKLASDDANYGAGQAVITPKVARGELIALARQWEQSAWVEGIEQFKADLLVERNASDRDRLDALLVPDLVNQFRVFAGQIAFIL